MSDVAKDIEQARKDAAAKLAEVDRLDELTKLYPDLKKHVGRWNKVAYSTPAVNRLVTDVEIRHNCGCCPDSPLEAWPYLETSHGRVYSDPAKFWVGERDCDAESGERPDTGWERGLRTAGIPETVIARIGAFMGVEPEPIEDRTSQPSREGQEP